MNICEYYHSPKTVQETLNILINSEGSAMLLAGGTDLLIDIRQKRQATIRNLVDITQVDELNEMELRGKDIFIGAAVIHTAIQESELILKHAYGLTEACGLIGSPAVRNVATIGGNVAHALPAADGTIALMALGARVEIAQMGGREIIPLGDLFLGPGKTILQERKELIIGFYIPVFESNCASAFVRLMRPQGVAIAILNCAVWVSRDEEVISDVRISIGPSGPTPRRLEKAEDFLRGKVPGDEVIYTATDLILEEARFRTSKHRAGKQYREKMAGNLFKDALQNAWQRTF